VEGSGEDISWKAFNWYLGKLNQFEIIHIPRLADIPLEDEGTADYLHSRGIKSFTAIPMVSNRSAIGYLGFESLHSEREWPADVLSVLKISADMFANLLNRKVLDKEIRGAREKGEQQVLTLEQHNLESGLITEMGELLQACRTAEEAYPIIVRYVRKQYPVNSGALYMIQDAKDPAEKVAAWGNAQPGQAEHELVLNECWGMRRGRLYSVQDPMTEPRCGHLKTPLQAGYLCVPLIAQGVAVGVLHLRQPAAGAPFTEGQEHLAVRIAEYIALSLVNLKLRDDLRSQAIRDPLTGLFNRRYMEETLDREIRRANRHSTTVGVIMLDIDQMKPINDHFGHDGGDLVLKALGRELLKMFRGEDVACRYGGDEFMIVVPEASLSDTWRKAEQIRDAVKRLNLSHEGKSLGPVSLSIGVGTYPDHGLTAERVVQSCDTALYAAKAEGRDRIMMGRETDV
jgi:diguanylate cyclase (GGDEF)-like protein